MKKPNIAITTLLSAATFFAVALIFAFVCWCGGFDYDCRNPDVGFGVAMTFVFAGGAGAVVFASRIL